MKNMFFRKAMAVLILSVMGAGIIGMCVFTFLSLNHKVVAITSGGMTLCVTAFTFWLFNELVGWANGVQPEAKW